MWIKHPDTGGTAELADEAALPAWAARGWEPCDPPESAGIVLGPVVERHDEPILLGPVTEQRTEIDPAIPTHPVEPDRSRRNTSKEK